jgi:dTDP-4-dehydrorhamnose reductase
MRLVLFGFSSFVGQALISYYQKDTSIELIRVGRGGGEEGNVVNFEVADSKTVLESDIKKILEEISPNKDTIFFNLISLGSPDYCELNQASSRHINYNLPVALYQALAEYDFGKFVHFSSNAVYAGDSPPYTETSLCAPINVYGRHKLAVDEYLLKKNDSRILVARPTTMYGDIPKGGRGNPVGMVIQNLLNGKNFKLVDDLMVNLLFVGDLCECVDRLVNRDVSGLVNIAGGQTLSRYDIGIIVAKCLGLDATLMKPCSMTEFPAVAKRPLDTTFSTSLLKEITDFEATPLEKVLELCDYKQFY